MKPLGDFVARLREVAERGKALAATPEAIAAREKWEREQAARERVESRERELEAWKRRGIPKRMWQDLDNPRHTSAVLRVDKFMTHPKEWVLFLSGVPGTGKTFAAAYACSHKPGSFFVKASGIQGAGPFDKEHRARLETAPLLVIDDLAAEIVDAKQFFKGYLLQILDSRYDAALKTILTTNIARNSFKKDYGDGAGARLMDRLRDHGAYFHCTEEESMRGTETTTAARDLVARIQERDDG